MIDKFKYYFSSLCEEKKLSLFYFSVIVFLCYGTGLVSDDFNDVRDAELGWDLLIPKGNKLNVPLLHYTHHIAYLLSSVENYWLISTLKPIYLCVCLWMTQKFFSLYMATQKSYFISFIYLFFPTHDATAYWFIGQYIVLTSSVFMYAYYCLEKGKVKLTIFLSFIGSFLSYSSPAMAFSFTAFCLYKKKYKGAFAFLVPNLIYVCYYLYMTEFINSYVSRVQVRRSFGDFVKNISLQLLTFLDANLGLSFGLKIFWSIGALSLAMFVAFCLSIYCYRWVIQQDRSNEPFFPGANLFPKELRIYILFLFVANLGIFAFTGGYPHLAFNLGNRVSTYSCLMTLIAMDFSFIPNRIRQGFYLGCLLAIFGLSAHWKELNIHQENIINDFSKLEVPKDEVLYVSGNQYSQLGPMANIEFLSEHWVVDGLVRQTIGKEVEGRSLSGQRFTMKDGELIDVKYGIHYQLDTENFVYDSEASVLHSLTREEFSTYLKHLENPKRHWLQFIDDPVLKDFIIKYVPRVEYSF